MKVFLLAILLLFLLFYLRRSQKNTEYPKKCLRALNYLLLESNKKGMNVDENSAD